MPAEGVPSWGGSTPKVVVLLWLPETHVIQRERGAQAELAGDPLQVPRGSTSSLYKVTLHPF